MRRMRSIKVMGKYLCTVQGLLLVSLALPVTAMHSASEKKTDEQRDGLSGPVKSVSKTEHLSEVKLEEPDGRSVLFWSGCAECEYDRDGDRTKFVKSLIQNSTAKPDVTFETLAVP